jgi:sarcosine oxidase
VTFGDDIALDAIAMAMSAAGMPVQRLTPEEAAQRAPSMSLGTAPVLFEPDSGVLRADACLDALCATGGFSLRTAARVVGFRPRGRRAATTVMLASGEGLEADVIVDCAGPRALALAGLRTPVAAPPSLPQVAYFARNDTGEGAPPPVFIEWGDEMIYGLPVPVPPGGTSTLYKVSHHSPGARLLADEPSAAELSSVDPPRLEQLCRAVSRLLPGLDPVPVATERCVYDNSADSDFVLDRVGDVVVGCGTSGHAFKFGPVIGELLADLAEGVAPPFDLRRFAIARPAPLGVPKGTVVR